MRKWKQIRATDSAGADKLVSTLGTGDVLKTKINTELQKQNLKEATGVSNPDKATPIITASTAMTFTPKWTLVLVMYVCTIGMLF